VGLPLVGAQPKRTLTVEGDVQTSEIWRIPPRWKAGHLVGHHGDSKDAIVFYTIDRQGKRDEFLFTFEGARGILIADFDIAPNGEIAVVGGAYTSDGRWAAIVARISPDRKRQTVTRVWPFGPMVVAIAADGSIWTIGYLKNEDGTQVLAAPVLRRYHPSGKMLSSVNVQVFRDYYALGGTNLVASRDRVGWLTRTKDSTSSGEYIEFSLKGEEIGRFDAPQGVTHNQITGAALSEENDVVVGVIRGGKRELLALDRSSRTWIPVSPPEGPAPIWSYVLGFDGTTLLATAEDGKLRRFRTK
jgi:hypothetical protein